MSFRQRFEESARGKAVGLTNPPEETVANLCLRELRGIQFLLLAVSARQRANVGPGQGSRPGAEAQA